MIRLANVRGSHSGSGLTATALAFRSRKDIIKATYPRRKRRRNFPLWDVNWDNARLAPTSTVRGWETLPLTVG
ncbi:MAG TPA: hypothetical protein VNF47_15550 [Streptosporangiaceae bacterium]|nr:hypothetical protein [Streptosporangiaceae bacterium]